MRDFVDALELALVEAAERQTDRSLRGRFERTVRGVPARYAALVAVASAIAVALVVILSSSPQLKPELAVLSRPAVDATPYRAQLPVLERRDADFDDARAIETPHGRGFVVPAPERDSVCLAIPDVIPGYAETCARTDEARRHGISITLVTPEGSKGKSVFVGVFPDGASRPEVTFADGSKKLLELDDGVAAATFDQDVTIRMRVGDEVQTLELPAHEPEGSGVADCGDGRILPEPKGKTWADVCRK